jgi:hypothetical protein
VGVKIQRRRADGNWRTVGTDQTNDLGGYRERISDRAGLYRAVAVRESLSGGADICARDRSPTVRHCHSPQAAPLPGSPGKPEWRSPGLDVVFHCRVDIDALDPAPVPSFSTS